MDERIQTVTPAPQSGEINLMGRIPVRNLWLLMLYASDLYRHSGCANRSVEDNPDDIPDLVAEILAGHVERRLRRNLTYGYRTREAVVGRVRGRIDLLRTERERLLNRGMVACRFEELTVDTPRNRYVRAALERLGKIVRRSALAKRCRSLSSGFQRLGVSGGIPIGKEITNDRFGRHDAHDAPMMAAARLAFQLALPTEMAGTRRLSTPGGDIHWIRKLFEKAVAGFYGFVLPEFGWEVRPGMPLQWRIERETARIGELLPSMRTDIVLDRARDNRRIVIDTKFNSILVKGWRRDYSFRSGYVYQMYAYLRSREGCGDPLADNASGILLHPSVGEAVDESAVIQGHEIRFATVDLRASALEIRERLFNLAVDETSTP